MTPQEIPYLALLRHENGDPRPPDLGSKASWGILTSSMNTEPVMDARRASLFSMAGAEIPGVSCHSAEFQRKQNCSHLFNEETSDFTFLAVLYFPCPNDE